MDTDVDDHDVSALDRIMQQQISSQGSKEFRGTETSNSHPDNKFNLEDSMPNPNFLKMNKSPSGKT